MLKYTKFAHVGPGGIDCYCCAPARVSKDRKVIMRAAKRREKKEAMKFACEE